MTGMRCYMGRFRVPRWLFALAPQWLHRLADRAGGVTREADLP
jgi:hypothetical protein